MAVGVDEAGGSGLQRHGFVGGGRETSAVVSVEGAAVHQDGAGADSAGGWNRRSPDWRTVGPV